jgi:hypothetical protein
VGVGVVVRIRVNVGVAVAGTETSPQEARDRIVRAEASIMKTRRKT